MKIYNMTEAQLINLCKVGETKKYRRSAAVVYRLTKEFTFRPREELSKLERDHITLNMVIDPFTGDSICKTSLDNASPEDILDPVRGYSKASKMRLLEKHRNSLNRIIPESVLLKSAMEDPDPEIREETTDALEKDSNLIAVASRDHVPSVRMTAARLIGNTDELFILYRTERVLEVRQAIVCQMIENRADESLLMDIALNDDSPKIQCLALSGIKSDDTLLRVVQQTKEPSVKTRAEARLPNSVRFIRDL